MGKAAAHTPALKIVGRNPLIIVILLLLAAAALRLPSLTLNSFWLDELYTANLTLIPFRKMLASLWRDVHPPLFNVLVYLWSLSFGTSEFALRMLPAFFGILTAPMLFIVLKNRFNTNIALVTSIFIIFLPVHIYFSQELRSYSLAFLLSAISMGILFWYLEEPTVKHRWALSITCAMLFATHYISIFYIITLLAIGTISIDGDWRIKSAKGARLTLITFFLLCPNLPHFAYKRLTIGDFWPPPVTLVKLKDTILYLFSDGSKTLSSPTNEAIPLAILYLVLIVISVTSFLYKKNKFSSPMIPNLIILSIVPLLGVIIISLISPNVTILINRIILIFSPPVIVLAAIGLNSIPKKIFTTSLMLLYLLLSSLSLYSSSYYTIPTKSDYREIVHEVARYEKEHSNVLLISLNNYRGTVLMANYYWQMFRIHNSERLLMPDNMNANDLLYHIRTTAKMNDSNKIILFSLDIFGFREDIVQLCNQHFREEGKWVFPGGAFLASYSLEEAPNQ